jgi:hypothetical protein
VTIRRATRTLAATSLLCVVLFTGCGGASKNSAEARSVALTNRLCGAEAGPGLGPGREARIRAEGQRAVRALITAAHESPRVARYLSDEERTEGEDSYRLRLKIYADKKALGLTACLGPPPRNPKCGTRKPGPSGPTLLNAEARRAVVILSRSPTLARLLHGVGYSIEHKGPWTGGEENCLVGAVLWLKPARPISIIGPLPTAEYEPNRFPSYNERMKYVSAQGVQRLVVEVDLIRAVVAGIRPS